MKWLVLIQMVLICVVGFTAGYFTPLAVKRGTEIALLKQELTNASTVCEQERKQAAFYATAILRALGTNHLRVDHATPGTNWIFKIRHTSNNQTVVSYELDLEP